MKLRVMTEDEVLKLLGIRPLKCGARPSPRSVMRCEDTQGHWKRDDSLAETHKGRNRLGYWRFWPVTDEEKRDG